MNRHWEFVFFFSISEWYLWNDANWCCDATACLKKKSLEIIVLPSLAYSPFLNFLQENFVFFLFFFSIVPFYWDINQTFRVCSSCFLSNSKKNKKNEERMKTDLQTVKDFLFALPNSKIKIKSKRKRIDKTIYLPIGDWHH